MNTKKILADFLIWSLPPTVNNLYGYVRGSVYKKTEVRSWQSLTIKQMEQEWGQRPPITSRVKMKLELTSTTRRKWDLDNRIKVLQDCLERAGVIKNDGQIWKIEAERKLGSRESTQIEISEYVAETESA